VLLKTDLTRYALSYATSLVDLSAMRKDSTKAEQLQRYLQNDMLGSGNICLPEWKSSYMKWRYGYSSLCDEINIFPKEAIYDSYHYFRDLILSNCPEKSHKIAGNL